MNNNSNNSYNNNHNCQRSKFKGLIFYIDSYRSLTRERFSIEWQTCRYRPIIRRLAKLHQAATSGECELTKFACNLWCAVIGILVRFRFFKVRTEFYLWTRILRLLRYCIKPTLFGFQFTLSPLVTAIVTKLTFQVLTHLVRMTHDRQSIKHHE